MKRIFLISVLVLFFASCKSDYTENKWIIINSLDKDVSVNIKGVDYVLKAGSMAIDVNKICNYADSSQIIGFQNASHLKTEDGWYYDNGKTWRSITIKKQELYTYNIFYDGSYQLYATSDLIRTEDGKLKKLIYDPHGVTYESDDYNLSDKYVYPSQPCYEKEIPTYIFYRFANDITDEQKKEFEESEYIDFGKMPYLVQMIPYTRFFESYKLYVEYPKEFVADESISVFGNSAD